MRAAIDRKQREAAGLDGAEDQHGGGRGRHQPDVAQEAAGLRRRESMRRAFVASAASTGMAATITSAKVTPNGRKPLAAEMGEQPRARRRSRATGRWRRCRARSRACCGGADVLIQNSDRMNSTVSAICRTTRSGNHIQKSVAKWKPTKAQRADDDHRQHRPGDAEAHGERRGERRSRRSSAKPAIAVLRPIIEAEWPRVSRMTLSSGMPSPMAMPTTLIDETAAVMGSQRSVSVVDAESLCMVLHDWQSVRSRLAGIERCDAVARNRPCCQLCSVNNDATRQEGDIAYCLVGAEYWQVRLGPGATSCHRSGACN